MTAQDWSALASALVDELHLATPPLAISFTDAAPQGVEPFADPMPDALPDGRTGRVGLRVALHARDDLAELGGG